MQGDNAQRSKAIPFEALPIDDGAQLSNLKEGNFFLPPTFATQSRIFPIILARPEAGRLVELRLSFQLFAADAGGFSLKLAIGALTDDLYWDEATSVAEIDRTHLAITGQAAAFDVSAGGELFLEDLDLLRAAPQPGDSDFSSDAICLLLVFGAVPTTTTGWDIRDFRVHGSSQQGLL